MPETSRAKFIVELDTAQAERDLARLRGGGGSSDGGPGGGPTGGGRTGGGTGGGQSGPTRSGPIGSQGGGGGGGGGFGLGKAAGLVAALFTFKQAVGELSGAVSAFVDAGNRQLLAAGGLREGALARIRGTEAAADTTAAQLGIAGAKASPEQIQRLFKMNQDLAIMREKGRARVQAIADPQIMKEAEPFGLGAGAIAGTVALRAAIRAGLLHR